MVEGAMNTQNGLTKFTRMPLENNESVIDTNAAQHEWKAIWKQRKQWREPRFWQKKIRREAALERALEAERRKNERMQSEIVELRNEIEIINHANEEYSLLCDFKEDLL